MGNMVEGSTAYTPGHDVELMLNLSYNGVEAVKFKRGPSLYVARFRLGASVTPVALGSEDHADHDHGDGTLAPVGHGEIELTPFALEKLPRVGSIRSGVFFLTAGVYRDLHLGKAWDANLRVVGIRAMHEAPTIGQLEMMVTFLADALGYRRRHFATYEHTADHGDEDEVDQEDDHAHEADGHEEHEHASFFKGGHFVSGNLEIAQQVFSRDNFKLAVAAGGGGAISYGVVDGDSSALYDWVGYGELRSDFYKRYQLFVRGEYEGATAPAMMKVYSNIELMAGIRMLLARPSEVMPPHDHGHDYGHEDDHEDHDHASE